MKNSNKALEVAGKALENANKALDASKMGRAARQHAKDAKLD